MKYRRLFLLFVLTILVVFGGVQGRRKCDWETVTKRGSTWVVKVSESGVEKRLAQWIPEDTGPVPGSVEVSCGKYTFTILDTAKSHAHILPFSRGTIASPEKDLCEVVFYSKYSTIKTARSPKALIHLFEGLQAMMHKPGTQRITCGRHQFWLVNMRCLAF